MSEQKPGFLAPDQLLAHLKWRYAVKKFDPNRKVSPEDWAVLEESLILSPSSFGLQPWKFFVVKTPELREKLLGFSWGQTQVVDASHLVVLGLNPNVDEAYIDKFIDLTATSRQMDVEKLASSYGKVIKGFLGRMTTKEEIKAWAKLQVYIALGQLMTSAAHLGIDACPMEGFMPEKYDEVLGLTEKGFSAAVVCPVGYRDESDPYASYPKVRFSREEMLETL
ncbi:MAG: NAD(P)H-dependent oxidoreductase [Cyanobacteria bacterium P01_F01_bin.150]